MEENNAQLQVKLLNIENGINYIQGDKKGGSGQSFVSRNAILKHFKHEAKAQGVKLATEVISRKIEVQEGKFKDATYLKTTKTVNGVAETTETPEITRTTAINIEAELVFTFCDTVTGFEKKYNWIGGWTERANVGFGLGALITYAKRQFITEFFNIESDETDYNAYEDKFLTDEQKESKELQKLIDNITKTVGAKELKFYVETLPDSFKTFENEDYKNLALATLAKHTDEKPRAFVAGLFNIPKEFVK